jgi:hypothetical protein
MALVLYRCPNTGQSVQAWVADEPGDDDLTFWPRGIRVQNPNRVFSLCNIGGFSSDDGAPILASVRTVRLTGDRAFGAQARR